MSDENLSSDRLEAVFSAVLKVAPNDRDAYLSEVCAGDPSLIRLVKTLVQSHDEASGYFGALQQNVISAAEPLPAELPAGMKVGPYRIDHRIGTGGMGDVYLAERADDQFRRKVALKIVRRGLVTDDMMRRFRSERQILALLDHPNIAKMYDGGVTDEGFPYFVMEYVEGEPITRHCSTHKLDVTERLRLFLEVCEAVGHAHRHLVVHRDLKPGNILVTSEGHVKLLDFGIAKLLDDQILNADEQVLTREDARVMTPDYASPEQLYGQKVSTSSDIYSLGVLLYELLTGDRPHRFTGLSRLEIEKQLDETVLVKPSERRLQVDEGGIEHPEKWQKQLRGDLDSIMLMTLRPEPERRYSSVERLANDINRFLHNLPVSARQDEFSYRLSKFVRRHALGVTVAAAMVVLVISLLTVTIISYVRISRQTELVRSEQRKAQQVADFLSGLFIQLNPNQSQGRDISARELLDNGAATIQSQLAGQPEMQSEMLRVMGTVYFNVADYDRANELFGRSYALADSLYGPDDYRTAEALYWVARMSTEMADYAAADSLFARVGQVMAASDNPNAAWQSARAVGDRGLVHRLMSRYPEAEPFFLEAIEGLRTRLGENHEELARMLNNYSLLLNDQQRYAESLEVVEEALHINRALHGDLHTDVLRDLSNMAANTLMLGDAPKADSLFEVAQDVAYRMLGEEHTVTVTIMNNRASLALQRRNVPLAEELYRKVIEQRLNTVGPGHPITGYATLGLANTLNLKGDYRQSLEYSRQTIENWAASLPPDSWLQSAVGVIYAESLMGLGNQAEGAPLLERHYPLLMKARGAQDPFVRKAARLLAEVYERRGDGLIADSLRKVAGPPM